MSQKAMLDNLEKELKETEFNGEQKFRCLIHFYFIVS